jgi:hypothetical protein
MLSRPGRPGSVSGPGAHPAAEGSKLGPNAEPVATVPAMTRRILACATLALLGAACGSQALPQAQSSPQANSKAVGRIKARTKHHAAKAKRSPREVLHAGDTAVQRYSGSFRQRPLTLTERVVSVEGDRAIIDYQLEEGRRSQHLKVERNLVDHTVSHVWRLEGGQETETGIYEYDEMLTRTSFAADANQGRLDSKEETCLVGQKELRCQTTQYQVMVAGEPAILTVSTSEALPGRDLSGTITDQNGNLLYRAELVELNRGSDTAVATRE